MKPLVGPLMRPVVPFPVGVLPRRCWAGQRVYLPDEAEWARVVAVHDFGRGVVVEDACGESMGYRRVESVRSEAEAQAAGLGGASIWRK